MSEYHFLATAGEEKLGEKHSDGVHLFFDMDWAEFKPVVSKPYEWLLDHVDPERHDRIEKRLDLLVVPLDNGLTVDYSEDSRVLTIGIGPYDHTDRRIDDVSAMICDNIRRFRQGTPTVVERRIPSRGFISRHIELGEFSIWRDIAPVILQNSNRLLEAMISNRSGSPHFELDRRDLGPTEGFPELRIDPRQRYTYFIQMTPVCSRGETEAACLNNYPGWNRVGSGSTKRYCFGSAL